MQGHFGPYELVTRLGVGGMAETFLAIRRGPGGFEQRVCLKRILPAYEADPNFVQLFMREARLSARLRHSNIAQVLDFGVVERSHFLALELIEGMDLRALLVALRRAGAQLNPGLVVHIAYELAAALDFAHAADELGMPAGVVHRDISASNVLLSYAGEVKLSDFGIAKAMNTPGTIQSGTLKGKVPYMAPEYARQGTFDARSDLFALGVVLYESLVGRRPFDGSSDIETLGRIMNNKYEPLAKVAPSAPPAFARTIEASLSASPEDRPTNAAQFLDSLAGVTPPPTARRALGALVAKHSGHAQREMQLGHDATLQLSPGGTAVLPGAVAKDDSTRADIEAGPPDAETRTRYRKGAQTDRGDDSEDNSQTG